MPNRIRNFCLTLYITKRHVAIFPTHIRIGRVAPQRTIRRIRVTTVVAGGFNGSISKVRIISVAMWMRRLGGPCLARSTGLCYIYLSNVIKSFWCWSTTCSIFIILQSQSCQELECAISISISIITTTHCALCLYLNATLKKISIIILPRAKMHKCCRKWNGN